VHSVRALLTDGQRKHLAQLASEILAQLGTQPGAEPRLCRLCDLEACGRDCPVTSRR
jgi:hypothetical protein